jgi:hypothetical protein
MNTQDGNGDVEPLSTEASVFILRDGRTEGPFPEASITMQKEAGLVSSEDLGWSPSHADWTSIANFVDHVPRPTMTFGWAVRRAWRRTLAFLRWAFSGLYWLTPKFWIQKLNRVECYALTSRLLPVPYDPVGEELRRRSRIVEPEFQSEDAIPSEKPFDDLLGRLDSAVAERRRLAIGATEMGAYSAYDVAAGFAAIDHNLFEGVSHLRSAQITQLSDLSAVLKAYDHGVWSGLSPGALVKVQGHVGESVVAEHLKSAGVNVDWPAESNNPGWDLAANGHHLDVKAAAKDVLSNTIRSHFAAHPEIPVVVSGDALHVPADAIHFNSETGTGFESMVKALDHTSSHQVFVDDALSHSGLHQHVHHATSAAIGSPDMVHHHFPIVTLALSGCKEMSLFLSDKTDSLTALKHVSLDATGTGVGGLLGAKAGAVVGSFFGPIGAGVGCVDWRRRWSDKRADLYQ